MLLRIFSSLESMLGNLLLIATCYVMILQWGYFLSLWVLGLGILLPVFRILEAARHGLGHDSAAGRQKPIATSAA